MATAHRRVPRLQLAVEMGLKFPLAEVLHQTNSPLR
jgi:hypothetical protein